MTPVTVWEQFAECGARRPADRVMTLGGLFGRALA
jgi:hypothetical protein